MHGRHVEPPLPALGPYLPAAHGMQNAGALAKNPDGQVVVQDEAPSALKRPATQGTHALGELPPVLGLNLPAAQGRQAAEEVPPVLGLYRPASQGTQLSEVKLPVLGLYLPAMHEEHDGRPPRFSNVPAGQEY